MAKIVLTNYFSVTLQNDFLAVEIPSPKDINFMDLLTRKTNFTINSPSTQTLITHGYGFGVGLTSWIVNSRFNGTDITYGSNSTDPAFDRFVTGGIIHEFSIRETIYQTIIVNNIRAGSIYQDINVYVSEIEIPAVQLGLSNLSGVLTRVNFGNDQIFGSLLNDIIEAGTGNDEVYGYDGNDRIFGDEGNDYLVGENGDDQLFGENGSDWLVGNAGNDWLVGGEGYDTLIGGDGDDGVVFDAGDNLAGYSGGAGYDILFFDAAGPLVNINLAAQGFEQAIGTLVETGTAPWASVTTIYNAGWQATKTEFLNDDGSKSIWRYDTNNNQSWSEIRDYYTADGKLDYEQTFFDDGATLFLDFDLNNEAVWFSRTMFANPAGVVTSDTFVLDAVLAQRSAEIGAIPVSVKAPLIDII